jgi:hypothetical protein
MSHEWMARRRVLALGLGGIAGLGAQTLIGGRKAMAQGADPVNFGRLTAGPPDSHGPAAASRRACAPH